MFCLALVLAIGIEASASAGQAIGPATDAHQVTLAAPQTIVEADLGKLKGELSMLAWSPDGSELYLQTVDRDRRGAVTSSRGYLVTIAGKSLKGIDQPPPWVSKYWAWKSGPSSPASPAFRIVPESRQETRRATAAVGDMAKGASSGDGRGVPTTSVEEAAALSAQSQVQTIWTLKLKGETLGEWINEPVGLGVNFGWAPAPQRLLAYTKREGGPIVLLDEDGHKQTLAGPKSALLPAWSDDARRLAWLERKDKRKFDLTIADVSTR
jgi:hypothetical protein